MVAGVIRRQRTGSDHYVDHDDDDDDDDGTVETQTPKPPVTTWQRLTDVSPVAAAAAGVCRPRIPASGPPGCGRRSLVAGRQVGGGRRAAQSGPTAIDAPAGSYLCPAPMKKALSGRRNGSVRHAAVIEMPRMKVAAAATAAEANAGCGCQLALLLADVNAGRAAVVNQQ